MNFVPDPRVQLIAALLAIALLSVSLVRRILHRTTRQMHVRAPDEDRHVLAELVRAAIGPVTFVAWYYVLFAIAHVVVASDWVANDWKWLGGGLDHLTTLGLFIGFVWYFYRGTLVVDARLRRAAGRTPGKLDDVLLPLLGTGLRVVVPILAAYLFVRLWPLSAAGMLIAQKLLAISLIAAITWTVRRAIILVDAAILGPDGLADTAPGERRALYTRIRMLRRIALVLLGLFAFAAVLMMFEEVRDIGRSILASAGIAGIVLGIAAQRSLGNLFAGIQIALTQPIRLGDQVIVEGDFAIIEEITLTYVIARTWDSRRQVLPISYFIEKPFQNWTHGAGALLSPLVLKVDFSLPVDEFRRFMQQEIAKSKFWDRKVFGVQVVDSDDRCMQIRVLASTPDSGMAWNLRCELREKAIDFIRRNYPECLPKARQEERHVAEWKTSVALTDGNVPLIKPASDGRPAMTPARPSER
ncbi:MAG TPA: mechanosensitive ion channel domain-containing protein [Opitutaceae bacterium]|nr:mechanosensitive ion channel domain-containing protein [Opitutaceae bacterium]